MSRGIKPIFVIRQETIVVPKAKPTVVEDVPMVKRVRYNEPKFNHLNDIIIRGVPRDWSEGIHIVNIIPRPNSPCCTYYHQIGHRSMNVHLLKIM
jgi:hypothetical protein